MVGCFRKTFRKTYVISHKAQVKPINYKFIALPPEPGSPINQPTQKFQSRTQKFQSPTQKFQSDELILRVDPVHDDSVTHVNGQIPSFPRVKIIEEIKNQSESSEKAEPAHHQKGKNNFENVSSSVSTGISETSIILETNKKPVSPNISALSQGRKTKEKAPLPNSGFPENEQSFANTKITYSSQEERKPVIQERKVPPIPLETPTEEPQKTKTLNTAHETKLKKRRAPTVGITVSPPKSDREDSGITSEESLYDDVTTQSSNLKPDTQSIKDTSNGSSSATFLSTVREISGDSGNVSEESIYSDPNNDPRSSEIHKRVSQNTIASVDSIYDTIGRRKRRSRIQQTFRYDPDENVKLPVYLKSEEDENLIRTAIAKNEFLAKVFRKSVIMDAIIDAMYDRKVHAKEVIIKQGDKGAHMYISTKGRYQIIVKGKPVDEFSDVRVFGELAILYNAPRKATVKALTAGKVWVLDQQIYQHITVGHYIQDQDEVMDILKRNEMLKVAGETVLLEVASLLRTEIFSGGEEIVRQGDKGHQFFIIRAGTVTITREGEGIVGLYKKGDCFGELALLKEDTRQATVTADPPVVECLTLTRKEFIRHFGEVPSIKDAKAYTKRDSVQVTKAEYEDIDIRDLHIITTLGVGGFGRVELVQHEKDEKLIFALKYLKKYDVVAQYQQEHVVNERTIQMACRSTFIVRMYRTFRDNKFVFFLMEPCLGGDVWGLLQKQKNRRFEETDARFICACVVEAFEYLHARGIIYRDLKPENLLIAENGYMKLTDFGFAKKMTERGKTFTFAGTPEYVAPEIVLNRGHDRAADYWTLGIFVYEMLRGKTPFRTDDSSHMKTYTKILAGIDNADFTSISHKARNLIEKLCKPIPADRLGMQNSGIKDIKTHRWYLGFEWAKFNMCQMHSPFKPKLKSPTDTTNIDKFKKDVDCPPDELSGWDSAF